MNATPSLADIAEVTDGNRNNDGFGNGNGWWVLIILFAIFGGWGNGAWGRNGAGEAPASNGDLQRGFDLLPCIPVAAITTSLFDSTSGGIL